MRVEKKGSFFCVRSAFIQNAHQIIDYYEYIYKKRRTKSITKKGTFSLRYFTVFYEKMQ